MTGRICGKMRYSRLLGDNYRHFIAQRCDSPDHANLFGRSHSFVRVWKYEGIRAVRSAIAAALHDFQHEGIDDSPDSARVLPFVPGFASNKDNLIIADVGIAQEQHISEVDAVAQVGEQPEVAVPVLRRRPLELRYRTDILTVQRHHAPCGARDVIPPSSEQRGGVPLQRVERCLQCPHINVDGCI